MDARANLHAPPLQDMPRPGGFPEIQIARNVPKRGPSGTVLFLGVATMMTYGFYKVIAGNQIHRRLENEKMSARIALVPFLQAEEDRREIRHAVQLATAEALLAKSNPVRRRACAPLHLPLLINQNFNAGEKAYHTDKYVPPHEPTRIGVL